MMKNSKPNNVTAIRVIFFSILLAAILVIFLYFRAPQPAGPITSETNVQKQVALTNSPHRETVSNSPSSASAGSPVFSNYPDFQQNPFPADYETPRFQWAWPDAKSTNVIRKLAHNPLEYDRMVEENSRIYRRQLVYMKQTAASVFENARLTGETVHQITLPGLDGQELSFEIVQRDSNGSSRQGRFYGRLVGDNDSLVTLAFQDGRQAFTVISPKNYIYVVGEPREPGQVIVKSINPDTYGVPPQSAEDAIKTQKK